MPQGDDVSADLAERLGFESLVVDLAAGFVNLEPERTVMRSNADVVRRIVSQLLPDGRPDVRSVARTVRVSTRTLQRRLSEEGFTFAGLVDLTRFDVAQRMLEDPARKVIDVALDLGYSDPAHFTRAFVRWTGLAPREFRRLRSAGAPPRSRCASS